jgi:4-amino-4-deoxy-L-arabinose transferase-like glycosyltransferase
MTDERRVPRRGFATRLLLIGLLALGVRVGYVLTVERGDALPGDGFYYHHAGLLLADGDGFIDPARFVYGGAQEGVFFGDDHTTPSAATALPPGTREPTAGHPPAWTIVLAAVSFGGLRSVLAHQLTGAVVGSLGVLMIGVLGREVRRGWCHDLGEAERTGLIAAGIAALYACLWLNDGMVMSESLVVGVVALATYTAVRFVRAPSRAGAIALGASGALAALTRAELVAYLPFLALVLLVLRHREWRTLLPKLVVAALVALAVVSPWVIRNTVAFDRLVLLSNGSGTVLVQANCDATYYGEKLGYWELYCGLPQPLGPQGEALDEAQRDVVLRERGLDYIDTHRTRLVTVVVPARVGRMWGVFDPVQQLRFDVLVQGRNFRLSALGLAQYYALVPCAIGGVLVLRRRGLALAPLLLWPAVTTLTAITAFGETRYRVASEVVVVVLASCALDAATTGFAARRTRGSSTEKSAA